MLSNYLKEIVAKRPDIQFKEIQENLTSKLNIDKSRLRYHFDAARSYAKDLNKKKLLFEEI
jgi:hypothetical protein